MISETIRFSMFVGSFPVNSSLSSAPTELSSTRCRSVESSLMVFWSTTISWNVQEYFICDWWFNVDCSQAWHFIIMDITTILFFKNTATFENRYIIMIYIIKWNFELLRCWQIEPHHTGKFSLRKSRGSRWGAKFSGGSGFQNKQKIDQRDIKMMTMKNNALW